MADNRKIRDFVERWTGRGYEKGEAANNVLCVRLVFCLFCEDADLFPKDAFLHYLLRAG